MTVLLRSGIVRLCAGAAGVFSLAAATGLEAQPSRAAPCTAPSTLLIAFPKAPDKATAVRMRDQVFSTFKDFRGSHFCLVPKEAIEGVLKGSGFATDSVLSVIELVTLGHQVRADEILEFEAVPVGKSFQFNGRVVLTRERMGLLRDSMPKHGPGDIVSISAKEFLAEFKKVQAMLELEKKCVQAARDEKLADAEAAGRQALAAMPSSSIARICIASALREANKNPEDIIKLTDEVLAKDPKNEIALNLQLNTYLAKGDQEKYASVGGRIIANSPAAPEAENIIANLAQWKKTEIVIQLLEKSLREDPDNLNLRKIEFRVILASDNLKLAQKKGEELAKLDTASVDTAFVNRMVNAYARDSQPQRAAEWLAKGTAKWPDNLGFAMGLAQTLRNLGQTQQAIAEYQRIIKLNPRAPGIRLQIANTYDRAEQPDSAYAWIRRAAEAGEDRNQAAGLVLAAGLKKLNAAQQSKATADWRATIPVLAYADSLNPADKSAGFYWGVASFQVALGLYNQMADTASTTKPSCPVAKEAKEFLLLSNEKVRGAPNTNAQVAAQILTGFGQLLPAIDGLLERLKCT